MSKLLNFAKQVAWTLPIGIAFNDLVASIIKVEGPSMQPTFNPDLTRASDCVLVEKISYKWRHQYTRGDVAVLWAPDNPRMPITKRLIAVEGDVVWDENQNAPEVLTEGRCWVEGDNAARSCDSRSMYGPVHLGLLEGRAVCIVWPPSRIGFVERFVPKGKVIQKGSAPGT